MTTKSRLNKNWLLYDHFKLLIFPSKTKFRLKITLKIQKKEPFFILSGRSVPLKIPILCFRLRKFSLYFSQLFFQFFKTKKNRIFAKNKMCVSKVSAWVGQGQSPWFWRIEPNFVFFASDFFFVIFFSVWEKKSIY